MDLKTKLSMLSGNDDFEQDLAGVSTLPQEINDNESDEKSESLVDFNLGALSIDSYLKETGYTKKKSRKSTKKEPEKKAGRFFDDIFAGLEEEDTIGQYRTGNRELDETTARSKKLLEQSELIAADSFDAFMDDDGLSEEEDVEMRNNLVSLGRKYARDSAISKESSEISKTFAESETKLKALYEEVSKDKAAIERDIERMRVPGRGGKILSDMVSAKNSYHNTQLAIVKELNGIKKTTFELRAKEEARKEAENAESTDINSNTLQSIFSSSRSNIVKGIGGYGGISGAVNGDSMTVVDELDEEDDELIQKKYFHDQREETDGDKWLKYEQSGVEYVLIVDEDGNPQTVFAEDRDGNQIFDYPVPDISNLTFEVDKIGRTATDNLNRNYKLRFEEE